MRVPSKCLHCDGPYEASVANVKLCHDCADKTFSVGYDEDGAVLHVFMKDGEVPHYSNDVWIQLRAFRPDGKKAKKRKVSVCDTPH